MIPGAGAETAVTVIEFEQSAMGAADDQVRHSLLFSSNFHLGNYVFG